jgi:hypothetical protein
MPTSRATPNAVGNVCQPNLRSMSPASPAHVRLKVRAFIEAPPPKVSHARFTRDARTATGIQPLVIIGFLRRAVWWRKISAGDGISRAGDAS